MKLYMKQRMVSLAENFNITDEDQRSIYRVEGKIFSVGRTLTIRDAQTNESLAVVKHKILSVLPCVEVYVQGELFCTIQKKLTIFTPNYVIRHLDWTIKGDIMEHEYQIYSGDQQPIAAIRKKYLAWADTYELDIRDQAVDPVMIVGVALAIDGVLDEND